MTPGNASHGRADGYPSWSSPVRSGPLGVVVQMAGALVIWVLVNDRSGRSWSTRDFQEWLALTLALAVVLATLGGVLTRRWRTGVAVLWGCLLATSLGCVLFIGHAVVNSA